MALLALALITSAVVAAFAATNAETVANNAMRAQDRAYQIAEAGMQQFMVRRAEDDFCDHCVSNPAQSDSEWTRVDIPGGRQRCSSCAALAWIPRSGSAGPATRSTPSARWGCTQPGARRG
jgi:hypothetical protein